MSETKIFIKRHNHRVHACPTPKKQDLLKYLSTLHEGKEILIISSANKQTTILEEKKLTLCNDTGLKDLETKSFDIIISFDLPTDASDYLERLAFAKEMALLLVDEKEETALYQIELLLGKVITREAIDGFGVSVEKILKDEKDKQFKKRDFGNKNKTFSDRKTFSAKQEWDKKGASDKQKKDWGKTKKKSKVIKISADKRPKKD
jgi:superfamily II DNA/RNA helicase